MPIALTVAQLRVALQLPERPYEDPYIFDGTNYWDFSHREVSTLLGISGTVSGTPKIFQQGVDFNITAGVIDWRSPGPGSAKPDLFTRFQVDYTYSKLSGDTASSAVQTAQMVVAQALGPAYPYGSTTTAGVAFNDLATIGATVVAAREACQSLAATEIDQAQKGRRGAILLDDSKKTTDWLTMASSFNASYKRYLTMIRPGGMVRSFMAISSVPSSTIFGLLGEQIFDAVDIIDIGSILACQ